MIKMIAIDLDGTLLKDNEKISDYTLSILEKCKEKGIKIVIATARGHSASETIDLINPDFSILDEGSLILDKYKKQLNNDLVICIEKFPAIEWLATSQNISLSEIAAFGDDWNDIEMLKYCGIGIAMENSMPNVKEFANFICGNNNEDGVAKWINENIL